MTDYKGPERRTVVTFTREDSDRLVRLEESVKTLPEIKDLLIKQNSRIAKVERRQSWMTGIGAAVTFGVTSFLMFVKGK